MRDVQVARSQWPEYFAALSARASGARTSVRVVPVAPTGAIAHSAGWLLHTCSYDSQREVLVLKLSLPASQGAGLSVFLTGPREILARESHGERAILILDSNAVRTLVRLRLRRPLPRPSRERHRTPRSAIGARRGGGGR